MKKVLFIQHANCLGGSVYSLKYTIEELEKSDNKNFIYEVLLMRKSSDVKELYDKSNINTKYFKEISTYEYSQAKFFNLINPIELILEIIQLIKLPVSVFNLVQILNKIKPDIVHLNSSVISSGLIAARILKIPVIWHFREAPPKKLLGFRKLIFKRLMKMSKKCFFISKSNLKEWKAPNNSEVVYNFVNIEEFKSRINKKNNNNDNLRLTFLGGVPKIKGGHVLLKTFVNAHYSGYKFENVVLNFYGGIFNVPNNIIFSLANLLSSLKIFEKFIPNSIRLNSLIKEIREKKIIKLKTKNFTNNVADVIYNSDVILFPATRPHFARPVIEAGVLNKTVMVSNIDGMDEIVVHGKTGYIINFYDHNMLYNYIEKIKNDKLRIKLGVENFNFISANFKLEKTIEIILNSYKNIK